MDNFIEVIGANIRLIRKSKNISQEELAFKSGLHPTYIGQIERAEKNLTISSLYTITTALEISLEEFFSIINPKLEQSDSLPFQSIIKLLQDMNVTEQKKLYEIIKQIIDYKKS
ncbi:helix-turn-helix domain-containing protein [Niallia sp. FSL W8-1348]|uniref:helix-turn-helix domain-containing protein n=1 Tax=Niallia sp. FSL W8-1348 TaxID=2954656 RepID=UPI0030F801EC